MVQPKRQLRKHLDDSVLVVHLRDVLGGLALGVLYRHVCLVVEEKLHGILIAIPGSIAQGRVRVLIHGVDVALGLDERLHALNLRVPCTPVERRPALLVRLVHIRPIGKQFLETIDRTVGRGRDNRGLLAGLLAFLLLLLLCVVRLDQPRDERLVLHGLLEFLAHLAHQLGIIHVLHHGGLPVLLNVANHGAQVRVVLQLLHLRLQLVRVRRILEQLHHGQRLRVHARLHQPLPELLGGRHELGILHHLRKGIHVLRRVGHAAGAGAGPLAQAQVTQAAGKHLLLHGSSHLDERGVLGQRLRHSTDLWVVH
mmetsp:Transcript_1555/g.5121  ORF Transcript_1555/g.5121 Transcript_1555/m.5121 type:complete len:311 (-) Transcript_1555:181-1113(-)